jgi:hypothetical protein
MICFLGNTPIVDTFSITEGTTADEITIDGLGFSTVNCQNKVTIGDDICTVTINFAHYQLSLMAKTIHLLCIKL